MASPIVSPVGNSSAPAPTLKMIAVGTLQVQVTMTPLPAEPVPAWDIVAIVGGTKFHCRHTIGATSGEIASYTQASLQAEIDAVRQDAANKAAAIESVRQMQANLT